MYWPVPIFFMITGATLLEYRKRYSTKTFLKKRLVRTFIPFVFWSIVAFYFLRAEDLYYGRSIQHWFPSIFGIVNHSYMQIYWFFVPLFAIYLSMPALNLLSKRWRLIKWLIVYAFISYSVFPFVTDFMHLNIDKGYRSPILAGNVLYVLLGYYLHNINPNKKTRYFIYILGILGWAVHFFGTLILTPEDGGGETINRAFKGYMNFPCVCYSVAVFVLFKQIDFQKLLHHELSAKLIGSMHASTLGIYLVHKYLLKIVVPFFHINDASLTWRIGGTFLIFFMSFVLVQGIKRIPLLRRCVP